VANVDKNGVKVELALWDTAGVAAARVHAREEELHSRTAPPSHTGQEDYSHIRPLSYQDAHVFLICFAVDNRDSFDNVSAKVAPWPHRCCASPRRPHPLPPPRRPQWVPEMKQYCPRVPYLIVGCKTDLRSDEAAKQALAAKNQTMVSKSEVRARLWRVPCNRLGGGCSQTHWLAWAW
jgi:Ras family protein A